MKKSVDQQVKEAGMALDQAKKEADIRAVEKAAISGYTDDRDLMNQLLGQALMSRSFAKFATVISLTKAAHIKKTKLYRTLKGKSAVDAEGVEIADVGTWDGFCRMLGTTRSKMDEDLTNLEAFGEEALNGLSRVGAGYRELRKLRKLPEEDRELIINGETVKEGDKEALVDLIEEMAAKHAKEKSDLQQQAKGLQGDLDASRRVIEDKSKRITELETEVHRKAALKPDERSGELSERLNKEVFLVKSSMLGPRAVIKEILDWDEAPRDLRHACAQSLARLRIVLDEIQCDFQLDPVDLDYDDAWMHETE